MPDAANPPGTPRSPLLDFRAAARTRAADTLMDAVRTAGTFSEVAKVLSPAQTYTVVFRGTPKGPLHPATGGLYEAAVRDGSGRYVQRVLLKPTGTAVAGALTALAVQVAMADISARLDRVEKGIDLIRAEQKARQRGNVLGALRELGFVHQEGEPARTQTLVGVRAALNAEFQTALENAKDRIGKLHDPHDTSVFNVFTTAADRTRADLPDLRSEVVLALVCAEGLAQVEFLLNGGEAATRVTEKLLADLGGLPLRDVQDKARRVPVARGEEPPDRFWIDLEAALVLAARDIGRWAVDGMETAAVEVLGADLLQAASGEGRAAAAE